MRECGIVTECKGNRATVKVDKKDECSKCGLCMFPKNSSFTLFYATNDIGAKKDDKVVVETRRDTKFLGAILAFLVPLLLIGVAVLINYLVIKNELSILIISVVLIALWYLALSFIDKRLAKTYYFCPHVIEILLEEACDNENKTGKE